MSRIEILTLYNLSTVETYEDNFLNLIFLPGSH